MKKIWLLILIGTFLVACSSRLPTNEDEDNTKVDTEEFFNERKIMEQAIALQKELLKPGFITKKADIENPIDIVSETIRYQMKTDKLEYQVGYSHRISKGFTSFLIKKKSDEEEYDESIKEMKESKSFKTEQLEGTYGLIDQRGNDVFQFTGKTEDQLIIYESGGPVEEGFDETFTLEVVESMKTEEDGAYERFYQDFAIDLTKLAFPMFPKDIVADFEVEMKNIDYWAFEVPSFLRFTYHLSEPDVVFNYEIKGIDEFNHFMKAEKVADGKTANNVDVSEYHTDDFDLKIYRWKNNNYYHSIVLDINEKALSEEEVYQMIDSSFEDKRTFKDESLFEETNTEPRLRDVDKVILEKLEKMGIEE